MHLHPVDPTTSAKYSRVVGTGSKLRLLVASQCTYMPARHLYRSTMAAAPRICKEATWPKRPNPVKAMPPVAVTGGGSAPARDCMLAGRRSTWYSVAHGLLCVNNALPHIMYGHRRVRKLLVAQSARKGVHGLRSVVLALPSCRPVQLTHAPSACN